jgi:nitroreductase
MTQIIDAMNWRYAAKAYSTSKKLDDTQVSTLIEAIRLAPSSFGLPTYKIIHVKNPELREKLKAAAWGQTQITDASNLFIFAAKTNITESDADAFIVEVAAIRNIPVDSLTGYEDMIKGAITSRSSDELTAWATKQAYIGLGVLLSAAALENIDASPMEGFDSKQFDEILGLKELGLTTVVIAPVGYRSENDAYANLAKVRVSTDNLVVEK